METAAGSADRQRGLKQRVCVCVCVVKEIVLCEVREEEGWER